MNRLVKFFHEIWNPHCPHCMEESASKKVCNSCETLRYQLETTIYDRDRLLNLLVNKPNEIEPRPVDKNLQPLRPIQMPWHARRQLLETEDREQAKLIRQKADELAALTPVNKLEEELGVADNKS